MSSQHITISPEFKKQVWLVAFDMDQTALDLHTSGVAVRDDQLFPPLFFGNQFVPLKAKEILDHVKDSIKVIIPELLQNGIAVAICTNTDVKMACHTSLMGGRELVEYIFGNTFSDYPDICNRLVIEAWRGLGEVPQYCGKNNHLARVWERIDAEQKHYSVLAEEPFQNFARNFNGDYFETIKTIDPVTRQAMISHTLLIDDDIINVSIAQRSGYMAFKVPVTGLTLEDWDRITKKIEQRKNCQCLFHRKYDFKDQTTVICDVRSISS